MSVVYDGVEKVRSTFRGIVAGEKRGEALRCVCSVSVKLAISQPGNTSKKASLNPSPSRSIEQPELQALGPQIIAG